MRKIRTALLIGCVSSLLCACGMMNQQVDTTTVSFNKNGEITEVIVEDFSQPYYNVEELKGDIEELITSYRNSSDAVSEDAVVLGEVELSEDKQIRVNMEFKSYKDYKAFNERDLFWGTVADAYSAGYEFTSMREVDQEDVVLSASDVLEKSDMHMVILEEAQQVILPGKIRYISDGVSVIEDKRAINLNEGQKAFIIYE